MDADFIPKIYFKDSLFKKTSEIKYTANNMPLESVLNKKISIFVEYRMRLSNIS